MSRSRFAIVLLSLCFAGCLHAQSQSASGLDLAAIDKSVNPCDDFYMYACGTWKKDNPIPADESSWGRFNVLEENNEKILRGILEDSAAHMDRSPIDQKIGAFYQSCMDVPVLDKLGKKPIEPDLEKITEITNLKQLTVEVARLQKQQTRVFFNFGSSPDPTNASQNIADLAREAWAFRKKTSIFGTIRTPWNCESNMSLILRTC